MHLLGVYFGQGCARLWEMRRSQIDTELPQEAHNQGCGFKFEDSLYHIRKDALVYSCIYSFDSIFESLSCARHGHRVLYTFCPGNKAGRE